MKPLVSIGMPVKNGFLNKTEKDINLEKALNSVLNQSYTNLEIIISNNVSTDETNLFLEKISKIDKRIKIYNQISQIPGSGNFLFVLSKATGKYFKWNCADDIISPDFIEKNIDFLENNPNYSCSSSKFWFEREEQNIFGQSLNQDLFNRIKNFFKIRFASHNIFYGISNKSNMDKIDYMGKNYIANDWMTSVSLLTKGNFKTIDEGYLICGNGESRSRDFFKTSVHNSKKIYSVLPFYEFSKDFFRLISFLKSLSYLEKLTLYLICVKVNFSFAIRKFRAKYNII